MGCWNETCGLTNLHIRYGEPVVVFAIKENKVVDSRCYTTPFFSPIMMPFYSIYNDYGAGENSHGFGLEFVLNIMREKLVELDVGENQYHDIAVSREDFGEREFFGSMLFAFVEFV